MPTAHINLLLRSKILVGIVMALLFLLGVVQVAQGFIDAGYYRSRLQELVKERTGKNLNVRGEASVSLLPVPTLYLPGVELRDTGDKSPAPSLTAEMVSITASIPSLFSGEPQAESIAFERPALELERTQDNKMQWGWLVGWLLPAIHDAGQPGLAIKITDGRMLYRNLRTDHEIIIQNIHLSGSAGAKPKMIGSFSLYGHALKLDAEASPAEAAGGPTPFRIQFSAGKKNMLLVEGGMDKAAEETAMKGKLSLEIENILAWTQPKVEEKKELFDQITNDFVQKDEQETLLPMTLSAEWEKTGTSMRLYNGQFTGLNSAGAGEIDIKWAEILRLKADLRFSAFNYDQWRALADHWHLEDGAAAGYHPGGGEEKNPLPSDIAIDFKAAADQVYVGGQVWKGAQISAALDHAAITINQFHIVLPGDATVSLFGIFSKGSAGGMRFEGNMETQGESLRQLLTVFDVSAMDLPETGFGKFAVRSNVYVASDQLRLSEADAQISDLHLTGGLVAYYDTNPRLEADVKLKNINFDYFRNAWREKQTGQEEFFLQYDKNMNFNWLRKLRTSIDFKVMVDGFTFLERPGSNASFRLFAKEGEFGIYNVRLYYPQDVLEGSVSLDVKGEQPFLNVLLNTSVLDTRYFSPQPKGAGKDAAAAKSAQRWSEDLIDMGWMEGVAGAFDMSIGKLVSEERTLENLKLQAKLENNVMTLKGMTFNCWQGRCSVSGSMYGGKVPGIALGFTLYSAELQDMLQSLVGRDTITGRVSISGTLVTSGVNYLSWVSQADSELILTGRGVRVANFNLQGVADAVAVSRTAADVVGNVNLALLNGATEMSVDGNINVKGGYMRTPGITLRSGNILGNLTGEIQLVPWTLRLSSLYQFPAMTSETVPTMTIQLAGPVDKPEMQVDTSSLEAYVAKRLIGSSVGQ